MKRAREERYYEILISSVTFADWKKIIDKACQQAQRGDQAARKWLSDYLVGQPEQDHNVDGTLTIKIIYDDSVGAEVTEDDAEAG